MPESLLYFDFEDERLGDLAVSDLALIPDLHARLYPQTLDGQLTFFQMKSGNEPIVQACADPDDPATLVTWQWMMEPCPLPGLNSRKEFFNQVIFDVLAG